MIPGRYWGGRRPATATRAVLYVAFLLSGGAGLVYEVVWSRYLALFVGHSAYAQVLVLGTFLGGMALGSLLVGQRSHRLRRPLLWYAGAELLLGLLGLAFDPAFRRVTEASYRSLFPSLAGTGLVTPASWTVAAALILPASVVLGTTFPLMAAGVLRIFPRGAGRTVGTLYFVNSLGGAGGVLLAGFVLVRWGGLPGTLAAAALLNAAAAAGAYLATRSAVDPVLSGEELERRLAEAEPPVSDAPELRGAEPSLVPSSLWRLMLGVSFLTAVASFGYEIGWIRMLSLVMGSATHSFEIMLSAFILGLALGAMEVRRWVDSTRRPLRALGWIQWAMGVAALATLPVYLASFDLMGAFLRVLERTSEGYVLFNLIRYGLAVAVMLPSTVLAGMTLPLVIAILLRGGRGERSIGWVYGVNTLGSILGVVLAGLLLLPWLGLKGLLVASAALDMGLGVLVLRRARVEAARGVRGRPAWAVAGLATLVLAGGVLVGLRMDRAVLSSGVYRYGEVYSEESRPILYYQDGRTATVTAFRTPSDSAYSLATNGKPDASLSRRWLEAAQLGPGALEPRPITRQDETTQIFLALMGLAHNPGARRAAVIGQGSGVTGHHLLGSPRLERVTTVELEPAMIEGSRVFYPANRRVFDDPRSEIVVADAKAFFAERGERWDLVVSEPSNPWVSGTASLFTLEFYRRVHAALADDGVLVQWIHLYELSDELVGSVLAALHDHFPSYRAYLANDGDLILVAGRGDELPPPDWSVFRLPDVASELAHVPPFRPPDLESLWVFDRSSVAPVLERWPRPNSDFHPVLDLGAERARYLRLYAEGLRGMAADRFSLAAALAGHRREFAPWAPPAAPVISPMARRARGAWLRDVVSTNAVPDTAPSDYGDALREYRELLETLDAERPPGDWQGWVRRVVPVEHALHRGTAGVADTAFYGRLFRYLDRWSAPPPARASVSFLHGAAVWDFAEAAEACGVLLGEVRAGRMWLPPALLLDAGVVALLRTGRAEDADIAYRILAPATRRAPGDFRLRLLRAHLADARGSAAGP